MEMDETAEQGAAREAREELNANVIIGPLLAVYSLPHIGQMWALIWTVRPSLKPLCFPFPEWMWWGCSADLQFVAYFHCSLWPAIILLTIAQYSVRQVGRLLWWCPGLPEMTQECSYTAWPDRGIGLSQRCPVEGWAWHGDMVIRSVSSQTLGSRFLSRRSTHGIKKFRDTQSVVWEARSHYYLGVLCVVYALHRLPDITAMNTYMLTFLPCWESW